MKSHGGPLVIGLVILATLVACAPSSSQANAGSGGSTYPLTIENYALKDEGAVWAPRTQVFDQAPQRVVANVQGAAELLIRLGLADRLVGVAGVFGDVDADVREAFAKVPLLSQEYAGRETILGANPDLVIGRGDLFIDGDWGSGSVEFLSDSGIHTYLMNSGKAGAVFDDFFRDIDELGMIFDVRDRADTLKKAYQAKIEELRSHPAWSGRQKKLAEIATVEDGAFVVSSGKGEFFQNEALRLVGLPNLFENAPGPEVSNETLIEANPDVLLLFRYIGGPDPEAMVKQLYAIPALAGVSAIQNKQVYVADFNAFYGASGAIFQAVGDLGEAVWK